VRGWHRSLLLQLREPRGLPHSRLVRVVCTTGLVAHMLPQCLPIRPRLLSTAHTVSMFNVSKNGRETRVEWLRVSDVRPRALYDVTPTLVSRCMALAEDVQPGCIYAIVSSDWANYIAPPPPPLPAGAKPTLPVWKANTTEYVAFCSQAAFRHSPRLMDTCSRPRLTQRPPSHAMPCPTPTDSMWHSVHQCPLTAWHAVPSAH